MTPLGVSNLLTGDLTSYLSDKRRQVEEHLRGLLSATNGAPASLVEAMRYSLLAPGKRLRPMLVMMANEACGGEESAALPAACAVEMVHTYSLIHDDLPAMDDDDLRRGLPTCHKKHGEALAILAGDALLTGSFQVLVEGYSPVTARACCRQLARGAGAAGMVGGQVEDLAAENTSSSATKESHSLEHLEHIHAQKTGALFRACLAIGVWVALGERTGGPDPACLVALDGYGRCFGQLFQITDDLLDVSGDADLAGKRVQKDAVRGKLTYPGLLGIEESRNHARQLCEEAHRCLVSFGDAGKRLGDLVDFVLERKH
jgi:geranylgeranyl diphosphate synthase type II